jgi:hypothetical protein
VGSLSWISHRPQTTSSGPQSRSKFVAPCKGQSTEYPNTYLPTRAETGQQLSLTHIKQSKDAKPPKMTTSEERPGLTALQRKEGKYARQRGKATQP